MEIERDFADGDQLTVCVQDVKKEGIDVLQRLEIVNEAALRIRLGGKVFVKQIEENNGCVRFRGARAVGDFIRSQRRGIPVFVSNAS